ncbi:MAG TPA: TIGR02266 family protein [Polyangia bacterium]|nr:TIGR02266 family protein [Polyangia bacterium]
MSTSAPVRVRLRYPDLDTFVERFAPNVTRGGVFIASRAPRPAGEQFAFEIQIATGHVALAGEGKVIWVKEFDPNDPKRPHGMGVQFVSLSAPSRALLQRMLALKGHQPRAAGMRGLTGPLATLQAGRTNGAARPRVDTTVDLAAEFGLDEAALRRALDRAWGPGARPAEDELAGLLAPEPAEPATLAQALKELPRMLDKSRRRTGAFRTLEGIPPVQKVVADAPPGDNGVSGENGVSTHAREE